ncbi:GDSL esterase/lipase At1g71691 [Selaginella moellendorffii]|uniref:GDSL esterase/lipase At1g71691 n=1 Tax=Selaginella moellendorffii TaxID=88036 RepID=UPI000D1C2E16|nr:GDSL esterase/lipase At1g71691 [Selaginella moellendorffii]|eukprot:XP_024543345.1 GDSL esterase/lipase At1g71691 [Selaginella moellendorffii]
MRVTGVRPLFILLRKKQMNSSVPALFAFGDSLVDAGDNAHVGYPYGVDFPGGQASRFCNGRLLVEYIAYFQAGNNILQGANFGSAGSGILSQTHTEKLEKLLLRFWWHLESLIQQRQAPPQGREF